MWYIHMGNGVVLTSTASLPCPSATSSTFVVGEWTFCQFIQALQMLCLELQIALSYEKSRSFTIRIFILLSQKKSRLCIVLLRRCWATKPYLSRSCIVLVPCQLRHDSVWNRLNPFESVTNNKCVLKESRLCGIFAASILGNQTLILFLRPVSFYMKPVNNLEIFHIGRLRSIEKE